MFRAAEVRPSPFLRELAIPCGKCIGCRLRQRLDWSIRASLEGQFHDEKCFVTLTYSDSYLPSTLQPKQFQDWLKRLRKAVGVKIRFFGCGEYGDISGRPHYHAILYGTSLTPRAFWSRSDSGIDQFLNPTLSVSWPFGIATVADFSDDYCSYVAGYVCKKMSGPRADPNREEPFVRASRRPGLGADWFNSFHSDCVVDNPAADDLIRDGLVYHGKAYPIPKFFERKLHLIDAQLYDIMKAKRASQPHDEVDLTDIMRHSSFQEYETHKHYKKGIL